jgi:glyoxylase-like metal-dependent hydrolase (beta-lactamase superfamily II)
MIQVGPYKVSLVKTGDFRLDGGAMFGVVPKTLWSKTNPADELNRIEMIAQCLLIESADKKILVDAGIGAKEQEKFNKVFSVDYSRSSLDKSFAEKHIEPSEITDLIYTHLHFDHAGGSTKTDGSDVIPAFENATHYVQKDQYAHALTRCERDRASYIDHNYVPIKEAGRMEMLDGDTELFPGIHLLTSSGHTPGMQTVLVTDGSTSVWFPADLIPLASQLHLPYIMGYDLFPLDTLADKKRYLSRACDEKWLVAFEHDPYCDVCTLKRDEKGRVVKHEELSI